MGEPELRSPPEPKRNLEDLAMARNPGAYLSEGQRETLEDRRTAVEQILAHLPNLREIVVLLDRIDRGADDPGEVEAWIAKRRKKEMIFMAIGDDAQRSKLMTLPVAAIMAESSGEDADALPSDVAVDRLKQRASELAKAIRGVAGADLPEEPSGISLETQEDENDGGPGF